MRRGTCTLGCVKLGRLHEPSGESRIQSESQFLKVAFPACRDEVIIYEVHPHPTAQDSVITRADKIVNGVREFMGGLTFGRDSANTWAGALPSARFQARWTFRVQGNQLTGELRDLPSGRQIRAVSLRREES